jgi:hypothetical protein
VVAVSRPVRIRLKVDSRGIVQEALEFAIERGMNRCDKYSETPLSDCQRATLKHEIDQSFWLALEDRGAEIR